jgi:hypothetical protein
LQHSCRPIRQSFDATLQRVVELGAQRGERTPGSRRVRTCRQILQLADGLWIFLEIQELKPLAHALFHKWIHWSHRLLRRSEGSWHWPGHGAMRDELLGPQCQFQTIDLQIAAAQVPGITAA